MDRKNNLCDYLDGMEEDQAQSTYTDDKLLDNIDGNKDVDFERALFLIAWGGELYVTALSILFMA